MGQISPLAYDYVPTTEVYDRLDEIYRVDVNWQEDYKSVPSVDMSVPSIKKSLERIRVAHNDKSTDGIEYHLCFWNSTRTLIKPQCKSLKLNSEEIWTEQKEVHTTLCCQAARSTCIDRTELIRKLSLRGLCTLTLRTS